MDCVQKTFKLLYVCGKFNQTDRSQFVSLKHFNEGKAYKFILDNGYKYVYEFTQCNGSITSELLYVDGMKVADCTDLDSLCVSVIPRLVEDIDSALRNKYPNHFTF